MTSGVRVEVFNGDQAIADTVASIHLGIRQEQVTQGVNKFPDINSSQADLKGIQKYYIEPGGNFWIARDVAADQVVGFVGLKNEAAAIGRVKRMAVILERRREGIGLLLGTALIDWARENGFELIKLATGEEEKGYDLYRRLGFREVSFDEALRDYHMELALNATGSSSS